MSEAVLCPQCGRTVPVDAPQGLCPACMMRAGLSGEASFVAESQNETPQSHSTDPILPADTGGATADFALRAPQPPTRPGVETIAPPTAEVVTMQMSGSGAIPVDVPGYEILGELGRGGMGVVYKAKQIKLDRIVALKMILAGGHAGSADLTRFRREAEAIARLQHPNIVQVHEIGEYDGKPYFSLEFCAGGSLAQKISGTPWQPTEAAHLIETLAHGMEAAHQKCVVHRDLKPANVLLLEDGTPKITDFGLAKKVDEASQTQSGAIMGTPSYMSPEQAGGKGKQIGPATDVYALGAILYELLTGRPPFLAATALDTVLQVVNDEPVPLSQLQSKTPRDLETICLKCLQKEAVKRYASANALAEDLRRFQANEPILARPISVTERARKWVRRRPMVASLLSVIFAVTIFGVGAFAWAFGQTLDARDVAIDQEKKTAAALKDTEKARKKADHEKSIADKARQDAESARKKADEEKSIAQKAREDALIQKKKAEDEKARADEQLELTRRYLHGIQLRRVAEVYESDPMKGLRLLHDARTCPKDQRDVAWHFYERQCEKRKPLQLAGHSGAVWSVAFSPDGQVLASGSFGLFANPIVPGDIKLWDLKTGKVKITLGNELRSIMGPGGFPRPRLVNFTSLVFSHGGSQLYSGIGWHDGAKFHGEIRNWDVKTGKPMSIFVGHTDQVKTVQLSPDGQVLASGSDDMTIKLWETKTGKEIRTLKGHAQAITSLCFRRDGRVLASSSMDGAIKLWDVDSGKESASLEHKGVFSVCFSPDEKTLASGSDDGTIKLWEVATRKAKTTLHDRQSIFTVRFSADGKTLLAGSGYSDVNSQPGKIKLWDVATGKEKAVLQSNASSVMSLMFHPDGQRFASAGLVYHPTEPQRIVAGDVTVWNGLSNAERATLVGHKGLVTSVNFSPDGKLLASGSWDRTVKLWEVKTGREQSTLASHAGSVWSVAFSPDGNWLASSCDGDNLDKEDKEDRRGEVRLWDLATGKLKKTLVRKAEAFLSVQFSPNSRLLACSGRGGPIRLFDVSTQKLKRTLEGQKGFIYSVSFSPDGTMLASASGWLTPAPQTRHHEIKLWDVDTGKDLATLRGHTHYATSVAFSPDGRFLATGSRDKTVILWDVKTRRSLATLRGHTYEVERVLFSPDSRVLISGAGATIKMWDVKTGEELASIAAGHGIFSLAFSPDGRTLGTAGGESIKLWDVGGAGD